MEAGEMQKKTDRARGAGQCAGQPLPEEGFVRVSSILGPNGPIQVSKSTWWAGVRSGRFPQPIKLGPRTTAWNVKDIRALIDKME